MAADRDETVRFRREYHERSTRISAIGLLVAVPVFALLCVLKAGTTGPGLYVSSAAVLFFVGWMIVNIPMAMLSATLTEDTLRIRNKHWKNYEFSWPEIHEIAFGYPEGPILKEVAVVILNSGGHRIPIHALYAPNPWTRPNNRDAQEMTAALEAARRYAADHGGTIPSDLFER